MGVDVTSQGTDDSSILGALDDHRRIFAAAWAARPVRRCCTYFSLPLCCWHLFTTPTNILNKMGIEMAIHITGESKVICCTVHELEVVTKIVELVSWSQRACPVSRYQIVSPWCSCGCARQLHGLLLVSGSEDGNVRVWDTRSQQVTRKFKHSQGPVTNVIIVMPKRINLPPLQPLRKVCAAKGEVEPCAVILPHPENDVHVPGNLSSNLLERCLDTLQHGGSSRLFDSGVSTLNGTPNQQGTEWRSKYLELQDLFVHVVLGQIPSSMGT